MIYMKLWLDDVRPAPGDMFHEWVWSRSVNTTKLAIVAAENAGKVIEVLDLDYDLGDYFYNGGDAIKLLDWLEKTGRNYPIRLHSMNPVGIQNMRAIIERNGWTEIV